MLKYFRIRAYQSHPSVVLVASFSAGRGEMAMLCEPAGSASTLLSSACTAKYEGWGVLRWAASRKLELTCEDPTNVSFEKRPSTVTYPAGKQTCPFIFRKKWTSQGPRRDFATRSMVAEVTAGTLPNRVPVGKPLHGRLWMTPKDVTTWTPQSPFFMNFKK
jgi:hypothetical protein